jgi:hypothetical protein
MFTKQRSRILHSALHPRWSAAGFLFVATTALAACSSAGGPTALTPPGGQVVPVPPPLQGFSSTDCSPKPCAVGSDGVAVSVSNIARVTTPGGKPVFEFNLRVVNGSPSELGVGPQSYVRLLLADRNEVWMDSGDGAKALGRPECYSDVFQGGTDTDIYHVQPGESLSIPKPLCVALDPSQAPVIAVSFSDENGPAAEIVNIGN